MLWSPNSNMLYMIPENGLKFYAINWSTRTYSKTYTVIPDTTVLNSNPSISAFAPSHDGSKIALGVAWNNPSYSSNSYLYVLNTDTGATSAKIESDTR